MPAVERNPQRGASTIHPSTDFSQRTAVAVAGCVHVRPSRLQPDRGFEKRAVCRPPGERERVSHNASYRDRYPGLYRSQRPRRSTIQPSTRRGRDRGRGRGSGEDKREHQGPMSRPSDQDRAAAQCPTQHAKTVSHPGPRSLGPDPEPHSSPGSGRIVLNPGPPGPRSRSRSPVLRHVGIGVVPAQTDLPRQGDIAMVMEREGGPRSMPGVCPKPPSTSALNRIRRFFEAISGHYPLSR